MIPNLCIKGSIEHDATVIKFLESLGGVNDRFMFEGTNDSTYYYIDRNMNIVNDKHRKIELKEITIDQANDVLNGKATISEDGTVMYKEEKKFPCMMWVWDDYIEESSYLEVHGHIPTLALPWIDLDSGCWKNASDTDPRIQKDNTASKPKQRDIYQELRIMGLTHDQCSDVTDLINELLEDYKN